MYIRTNAGALITTTGAIWKASCDRKTSDSKPAPCLVSDDVVADLGEHQLIGPSGRTGALRAQIRSTVTPTCPRLPAGGLGLSMSPAAGSTCATSRLEFRRRRAGRRSAGDGDGAELPVDQREELR